MNALIKFIFHLPNTNHKNEQMWLAAFIIFILLGVSYQLLTSQSNKIHWIIDNKSTVYDELLKENASKESANVVINIEGNQATIDTTIRNQQLVNIEKLLIEQSLAVTYVNLVPSFNPQVIFILITIAFIIFDSLSPPAWLKEDYANPIRQYHLQFLSANQWIVGQLIRCAIHLMQWLLPLIMVICALSFIGALITGKTVQWPNGASLICGFISSVCFALLMRWFLIIQFSNIWHLLIACLFTSTTIWVYFYPSFISQISVSIIWPIIIISWVFLTRPAVQDQLPL